MQIVKIKILLRKTDKSFALLAGGNAEGEDQWKVSGLSVHL